jgi:hypothetical protein
MQKFVAIDGGKKTSKGGPSTTKKGAILMMDGEEILLDSFVLSGTVTKDGETYRTVLTYNSSIDEMVVYKNTLNIMIDDKVRQVLK